MSGPDDATRMNLTFELQITLSETSAIAESIKEGIEMHLATTDELTVDALAHLALDGWRVAKPVLRDMWRTTLAEFAEALEDAQVRGVPEGIAA